MHACFNTTVFEVYYAYLQLVGGSLDLKENFKIREPQIIPLLFELLPHCSESLQVTE